ncbi:MAG: zf-HC2 domain-containing protein [Clostridia bacterium]
MNKISCDVCMDLMPLVLDDIASEDSENLVHEHIKTCENCKKLYTKTEIPTMEDAKVINNIKKQVRNLLALIVVLTTMFSASITGTSLVFYNVVLMPIVGGLSYAVLKKKTYLALLFIFITVCLTNTAWLFFESQEFIFSFMGSISYAGLYVFVALIGVIVAVLLEFGFKKEK